MIIIYKIKIKKTNILIDFYTKGFLNSITY